jgi:hypothetical protein
MFAASEAKKFLDGLKAPENTSQETLFEKMIRPNEGSELGKKYGFGSMSTIDDYRSRVPISSYEDLRPLIERVVNGEENVLFSEPVRRFFLTSGSTSKPKYVPVTSSFIRDKSRAFGIYWSLVFEQHPEIKSDKIVTNFSDSGEMSKAPSGMPASSESAYWSQVTAATQRRSKPFIPKIVARIKDNDARYYAIARVLLEEDFQALMTLNPSTIYLLFQKLNAHGDQLIEDVRGGGISVDVGEEARALIESQYAGNAARADALRSMWSDRPPHLPASRVWQELKLVVSWRSPMLTPYLKLLEPHLSGVIGRDYISMASEGIISIPVGDGQSGGALAAGVHFYELIPEEDADQPSPLTLLPHEAELGKSYVVVLTTNAGLYRYNIGDVVRVNGFVERTPRIEFLHRAGNTCSLTGEKLTEDQVTGAIDGAAQRLGLSIESFTAQPAPSGFPRYVFLVELREPAPREKLTLFPAEVDRALDERNIEYGSKRSSERLGAPELWLLAPGSYRARKERRMREGANDVQLKPTHLVRDARFCEQFEIVERFDGR